MMARLNAGSESGFAVPVVTFMLLGMMAILGVGAVAAMNTQSGTVRDTDTKSALAVAESGVDNALLRYARAEVTETEPCVDGSGSPTTVDSSEWCEPVSGQVDGSDYTYYVRPEVTGTGEDFDYQLEIVSVGTVDGVSRVVDVDGTPIFAVDPEPVYLTESLVADHHMQLAPGARIDGSIGSNGVIDAGSSTEVCGGVRYGPGSNTNESDMTDIQENCAEHEPEEPVEKDFKIERPTLPEGVDWDTNNSHFQDLEDANPDLIWDPDARTLETTNNVEFTITEPGPFLLCRMDMTEQSVMHIAPGVEAQFYFDDPANCNLAKEPMDEVQNVDEDGYLQMLFDRGNLTVDPDEPYPLLYFLGSETDETFIDINTNSGSAGEFKGVIYAPDTHIVNSKGGLRLSGAMVGRSVWINAGSETDGDAEIIGGEFQIGINEAIYTVFMKGGFRECPVSAADSTTPYENC